MDVGYLAALDFLLEQPELFSCGLHGLLRVCEL